MFIQAYKPMPLYTYVFSNSMKVPEGQNHTYNGKPQVGVSGSSFYSLEPISKGVSINKKGNAVATDVGTYQVKAKIKDGFLWEITDPGRTPGITAISCCGSF